MLYSPVGCHILNKTNYLVDIHNPAEVCDNGAPCLLGQTQAFSPQRAAKRPQPAPAAEECAPIPCLSLPACPARRAKPVRIPWHNFLARIIIFMLLLGKLQWLILYSRSSMIGFSKFFFLLVFWSAKLRVVCLTMCNAWRTDGVFYSTRWHAKMKFYPSKFGLCHFIWNGGFNSYFATQQLHCISFHTRYNLMTNSALSSQQSALRWYLTQDYLKLPSCTNTYIEKVFVLENLQCRQGKWFSKCSSSSRNRCPGSQAHCRADYTDGLLFSRTGANSLLSNLQILL